MAETRPASSTVLSDAKVFAFAPPAVIERLANCHRFSFNLFLQANCRRRVTDTLYARRVINFARNGAHNIPALRGAAQMSFSVNRRGAQYSIDRPTWKKPRCLGRSLMSQR